MHTRALTLNDAFTLVRDRKPDVSPNFHFMQQLHVFERQHVHQLPSHHQHPNQHLGEPTNLSQYQLQHCHPTAMDEGSTSGGVGVGGGILDIEGHSLKHADDMIDVNSGLSSACPTSSSLDITMVAPKYSCDCLSEVCKGVQHPGSGYLTQLAKAATGISPDSGIEFDRWAPSSSDSGHK